MQVYIPAELVNSNEEMKKFFVNDRMICVPVGKFVDCTPEVAEAVIEWIKAQEDLRKKQDDRAKALLAKGS